jgi:hypothetical protein
MQNVNKNLLVPPFPVAPGDETSDADLCCCCFKATMGYLKGGLSMGGKESGLYLLADFSVSGVDQSVLLQCQ